MAIAALALVLSAAATDLRVTLRSPTGETTAATFHDVQVGELPALRLPARAGRRWTASFTYDDRFGATGLSVRLAEQVVVGPFAGVPNRQLAGRVDLRSRGGSTRIPLDPRATLPSAMPLPAVAAWVVEARVSSDSASARAADDDAAKLLHEAARAAAAAGDVATALRTLEELGRVHAGSKYDRLASQLRRELSLVGLPAPALRVARWLQGAATYSDNPATLLVFFEVWCPHCKREVPRMMARADELRAAGVTAVLVTRLSRTSTEEKTVEFLHENEVWFPVAVDEDGLTSKAFEVSGIPAAALVRDGTIVWRGHPARLDATALERLLSAPIPPVPIPPVPIPPVP